MSRTYEITLSDGQGFFMGVVLNENLIIVGDHPDMIGVHFQELIEERFPVLDGWKVHQHEGGEDIWDAYASQIHNHLLAARPEEMVQAAKAAGVGRKCLRCLGSGVIYIPHYQVPEGIQEECPDCNGEGRFIAHMDAGDVLRH